MKPAIRPPADVIEALMTLSKACLVDLTWELFETLAGESACDLEPYAVTARYLRPVAEARGDRIQRIPATAELRRQIGLLVDAEHLATHGAEIEERREEIAAAVVGEPPLPIEVEDQIRAALTQGNQQRLAAMTDPEVELALRIAKEATE